MTPAFPIPPRQRVATATILVALALTPLSATATEEAPVRRWLVGVDAAASTVDGTEPNSGLFIDETSWGLGLQLGWLVSPSFMVRVNAIAADHELNAPDVTVRVGGIAADAVFLFRDGHGFRPYLFAGVGGYVAESRHVDLVYDVRGPGAAFGAGTLVHLGGRTSLHGALRVEAVNWEDTQALWNSPAGLIEVEPPLDESGWTSKVLIGLAFRL
jgi:hypothetical protein